MAIGAVGSENSPYVQKAGSGGDDATQLKRQKEVLKKQLEAVKSKKKNSQAEQDAAVRQIKLLKSRIAEIDQKIQKLTQNQKQSQSTSESAAIKSKKEALAKSNSPLAGAQNEQSVLHNMQQDGTQEKEVKNKFNATGKLLDTYA